MPTLYLLIGIGVFAVLFLVLRRKPSPIDRLPVDKRREMLQLEQQLRQALSDGDARGVFYYDGLQFGILALYLPELEFFEAKQALEQWRSELH